MAYTISLFVHSYLRWLVLVLGIAVLVSSVGGWRTGRAYERRDDKLSIGFISLLDMQMLLGLVMYFVLSPITSAFLANAKAGMKDHGLRFFGVEHLTGMLLAVLVVHIGRARGKRREGAARHKLMALTTIAWLLLTLGSIPWPGLVYGRALFRLP